VSCTMPAGPGGPADTGGGQMSGFPRGGDNFRTTGAWNIVTGRAWFDWRCEAVRARIAVAEAVGEPLEIRRLRNELADLEAAGPVPVDRDVFG